MGLDQEMPDTLACKIQTGVMASKYDPLRRHLEQEADDEPVSLTLNELVELVGDLPPSSATREWWANTAGHSQAQAWLQAGRRVTDVRLGEAITFSPAGQPALLPSPGRGSTGLNPVMDGVKVLETTITQVNYNSVVAAVAANALFLHPETPLPRPTANRSSQWFGICTGAAYLTASRMDQTSSSMTTRHPQGHSSGRPAGQGAETFSTTTSSAIQGILPPTQRLESV